MLESEFLTNVDLNEEQIRDLCNAFDRFDNEYLLLGGQINFVDYLFLRKANLAWKECTRDNEISVNQMPCALDIIGFNKRQITKEDAR